MECSGACNYGCRHSFTEATAIRTITIAAMAVTATYNVRNLRCRRRQRDISHAIRQMIGNEDYAHVFIVRRCVSPNKKLFKSLFNRQPVNDIASIILIIFILLLFAKITGGIFEKLKMPKLIGEILAEIGRASCRERV